MISIKPKTPSVKILAGTDARPKSFAPPNAYGSADPGSYDPYSKKAFGSDAKPFRIGERRPENAKKSAGPGDYDATRAESQTKARVQSA